MMELVESVADVQQGQLCTAREKKAHTYTHTTVTVY